MSKPQTIIRAKHDKENPYFMMRRDTAQDESLSWEARGMLCYLLSKPDDWEIEVKDLQQQCGKNRVYKIINELKDAGYISDRTKKQNPDTGRWEWSPYIVYETPQQDKIIHIPNSMTWKPEHGNPDTGNGEIKQSTENKVQKQKEHAVEGGSSTSTPKKKQELLGDAFGVQPITGQDWSLYGKVCKQLAEANIEPSEYADYISWVKKLAKGTGGWKVTIPSLISGGRVSDYVATKQSKPDITLKAPEQDLQALGQDHIRKILTGEMGESA